MAAGSWWWRWRCRLINGFRAPAAWLARRPGVRRSAGWLRWFSPQLHYRARRFAGLAVSPEMPASRLALAGKAVRGRRLAVAQVLKTGFAKKEICSGQTLQRLVAAVMGRPSSRILPRALRPGERPRLALVSPMPPERTGIADYCAALLPGLACHYDIDLVTDQAEIAGAGIKGRWPVRSVAWFSANAGRYHRVLYHVGNSPFHLHMFGLLEKVPGVVVLHDFFLSDVLQHAGGAGLEPGLFARSLYASHGYAAMSLGHGDCRQAIADYPANWPVFDHAVGVLVHSRFSRQLAVRWYGDSAAVGRTAIIPFLRAPPEKRQRRQARQQLGLGPDDFVVCSFGFLGPTKWNERLLRSWLASALAQDPRCRLVFVGENHPQEYGEAMRRAIAASPARERIAITGFASPDAYAGWLAAADLAVQLRTQSRGETSAAVFDSLAQGLPLILNANGSAAEIPDAVAYKLPDAFTDDGLQAALESLYRNPELRARYAGLGAQYILERHLPATVVPDYHEKIEALYAGWNPNRAERLPSGQPTLFVDVSVVAREDYKTGVQRVVRAIMSELLKAPPPGFRVEPVYELDGHYSYARRFAGEALGLAQWLPDDEVIAPRRGDVFLGLDLSGDHLRRGKPFLQRMRQDGCRLVFVVYDLIPLLHPEWFLPQADRHHQAWLENVVDLADALACISQAVATEVGHWLAAANPECLNKPAITHFHLGADIASSLPSVGMAARPAEILKLLAARPTFIMVGTIEPRKGHRQTLAAFEQLWRQGVEVNLVVVGKAGWCVEEVMDRIQAHPEAGRRFFWLDRISDEMLLHVYQAASALIAASEAEGFGLPLIEAARQGVPIIARDLPVFREVAGDHAYYFHGREPEPLAAAIQQWLDLHQDRREPTSAGLSWLTWEQSARWLAQIAIGNAPAGSPRNGVSGTGRMDLANE
jgi:glycosyltransferase involved in cell wall biosynthesis